jgi:hypothetical protein
MSCCSLVLAWGGLGAGSCDELLGAEDAWRLESGVVRTDEGAEERASSVLSAVSDRGGRKFVGGGDGRL